MTVSVTCRGCGKAFEVKPSRAGKALFCSRLCCYGPGVQRACERCAKRFRATPTDVAAGRGRFCSHACRWPNLLFRSCARCGAEFKIQPNRAASGRGVFCSKRCYDGGTLAERFARHVSENGPVPEHRPELGPCHVWTGSRDGHGYGQIQFEGRLVGAHRAAFFLAHARWPQPCALHKCDGGEIGCVRSDHITEGTHAENTADMIRKGRHYPPPGRSTVQGDSPP